MLPDECRGRAVSGCGESVLAVVPLVVALVEVVFSVVMDVAHGASVRTVVPLVVAFVEAVFSVVTEVVAAEHFVVIVVAEGAHHASA